VGAEAAELTGAENEAGTSRKTTERQRQDNDGGAHHPALSRGLFDLDDLLDVLDIRVDGAPVVLRCLESEHGGILGAQLLAQQVVLAERLLPGWRARALHTLFTLPGRNDRVLEVDVERLPGSQAFAALGLTFRQGKDVVSRAQVLLSADDHTPVPHQPGRSTIGPPEVRRDAAAPPARSRPMLCPLIPWEARVSPQVDSHDIELWLRVPPLSLPAGDDAMVRRALLAHASVGTAPSRVVDSPEPGRQDEHSGRGARDGPIGNDVEIYSHTLTFTASIDVHEWHLMRTRPLIASGELVVCNGEFRGPEGDIGALFETVGIHSVPDALLT
jgi:acyl-CoA thioesterase-2